MLLYLIVASKTWTVESLSNETVLITNLTAFWNSDEFPIIFKQRNTHHYKQLEMTLRQLISHRASICTAYGFATVGEDAQKEVAVTYTLLSDPGQTASLPPTTHSRILSPSGTTVWMNTQQNHPGCGHVLPVPSPPSAELTFICKAEQFLNSCGAEDKSENWLTKIWS